MRPSAVLCSCLLISVSVHSDPAVDVRIHMDEQKVFEDDGTYEQPDVVIRRSSHKNNLRFDADRLEGREPPTRPGINQLIREDHEEERRRRYELESDEIVQRNVGDADEFNNTNLTLSPRSNAYRAPNKAKPLPIVKRRYIGLTPDYSDEPSTPPPASQKQVAQKKVYSNQSTSPTATRQTVSDPVRQPQRIVQQPQTRQPTTLRSTSQQTSPRQTLESVVYPGAASSRPRHISQPVVKQQTIQQPIVRQQSVVRKNPVPKFVAPSGPGSIPETRLINAQKRTAPLADERARSNGASYRLGQSNSGYPSIGFELDQKKPSHRVLENGQGERLIIRDVVVPEPVYQQRLINSDDEYLKLAPPELWEEWDNQVQQQTVPVEQVIVGEFQDVTLIRLPVAPRNHFSNDYVWGFESESPMSERVSDESQFAFGLPWQYLSRGWQIPPMADGNSKFAFLWFVVDLHQTTRDAFKLRLDALESEVFRNSRQRKLDVLESWIGDSTSEMAALPKAELLVWEQQKRLLENELGTFAATAQAGLSSEEKDLLNDLEQQELKSLEDLILQYRQSSLEYRFYRQYFTRLTQPGYGMSTRLSSSELDALAGQEEEMKETRRSLKRQLQRLDLMLQRYAEYSERVDYLRQQNVLDSSMGARSELVATVMGLLDQEEAILIQRLRAYRDVWLIGWHTNQFATWPKTQ